MLISCLVSVDPTVNQYSDEFFESELDKVCFHIFNNANESLSH